MIGLNGLQVVASVVGATFTIFYGLAGVAWIGSRVRRSLDDRIARRYWRTMHTRTCDVCSRVWERVTRDYDADLGFAFDRPGTCPACQLAAGKTIEIDIETMSAAEIKAALWGCDEPEIPAHRDAAAHGG